MASMCMKVRAFSCNCAHFYHKELAGGQLTNTSNSQNMSTDVQRKGRIVFLDLDDTLYKKSTGFARCVSQRISQYMSEILHIENAEVKSVELYHQYGTTLTGLLENVNFIPLIFLTCTRVIKSTLSSITTTYTAVLKYTTKLPKMMFTYSRYFEEFVKLMLQTCTTCESSFSQMRIDNIVSDLLTI